MPGLFKKRHAVVIGTILGLILGGAFYYFYTHRPLKLEYPVRGVHVNAPFVVKFNQEVALKSDPLLSPKIPGTWYAKKGFFGIRSLEFQPELLWDSGVKYHIDLTLANAVSGKTEINQKLDFSTQPSLDIISFSIDDDARRATINPTFELFVEPTLKSKKLSLLINQNIEATLVQHKDNRYLFRLNNPLDPGRRYRAQLWDQNDSVILEKQFLTAVDPEVIFATQKDHFYPGDGIDIVFNTDMRQDFSPFQFEMEGGGVWKSDRTYHFLPENLKPGNTYTYRVLAGAYSVDGSKSKVPSEFSISTPGELVVNVTPDISDALEKVVRVSFDQPVDKKSAESALHIVPSATGEYYWPSDTIMLWRAKLNYQTNYVVRISSGIKTLYGISNKNELSFDFSTKTEVIKLAVPYYKQEYQRSCEEAALRMALAFYNIKVSDWAIVQKVGYHPRERDTNTNIWDDPNKMFVGFLDPPSMGYGTYAPAIARAAKAFGRISEVKTNITASYLSRQIHEKHPVVIWGYFTPKPGIRFTWNLEGGGTASAYQGEHARTVMGVVGSINNPVGFYVHDPLYGGPAEYWPTAKLMNHMNVYGELTNQAVVVK